MMVGTPTYLARNRQNSAAWHDLLVAGRRGRKCATSRWIFNDRGGEGYDGGGAGKEGGEGGGEGEGAGNDFGERCGEGVGEGDDGFVEGGGGGGYLRSDSNSASFGLFFLDRTAPTLAERWRKPGGRHPFHTTPVGSRSSTRGLSARGLSEAHSRIPALSSSRILRRSARSFS